MHSAMSDLNNSVVYQVPAANCGGFQALSAYQLSGSIYSSIVDNVLSFITIWRVLVLLLVLGNVKNIPLIWHVSISKSLAYSNI